MSFGKARNGRRDFEILKAALAGASIYSLASQYNLAPQRIQVILTAQRHKINLSPNPVYRSIREAISH